MVLAEGFNCVTVGAAGCAGTGVAGVEVDVGNAGLADGGSEHEMRNAMAVWRMQKGNLDTVEPDEHMLSPRGTCYLQEDGRTRGDQRHGGDLGAGARWSSELLVSDLPPKFRGA